jgi:hypothetical protein
MPAAPLHTKSNEDIVPLLLWILYLLRPQFPPTYTIYCTSPRCLITKPPAGKPKVWISPLYSSTWLEKYFPEGRGARVPSWHIDNPFLTPSNDTCQRATRANQRPATATGTVGPTNRQPPCCRVAAGQWEREWRGGDWEVNGSESPVICNVVYSKHWPSVLICLEIPRLIDSGN